MTHKNQVLIIMAKTYFLMTAVMMTKINNLYKKHKSQQIMFKK